MKIHPKVRWAAFASSVCVALAAVQATLGDGAPAWFAAAVTGLAAFVAGYFGPAVNG